VNLETIARCGLVLEAIACLWIARTAWAEAEGDDLAGRLGAPLLACAAAAVILYGAFQ
jgi:hypothetical protein